ncbi:MAG: septum formation initiator family protein [Bacteroidaceae bacterium]|nr:septum formation initiator family protein [Bacteroidaceae bacterium]
MKMNKEKISDFMQRYVIRYISPVLIVSFVIWHLFIARNNYIDICRNDNKIRELEKSIAQEEMQILQLKEEISNSESDTITINRIAREKHGMQQAHEDVYIVISE